MSNGFDELAEAADDIGRGFLRLGQAIRSLGPCSAAPTNCGDNSDEWGGDEEWVESQEQVGEPAGELAEQEALTDDNGVEEYQPGHYARKYLAGLGLEVQKDVTSLSGPDQALLPLATELGNKFHELEKLHDAIRRSLSGQTRFSVRLDGATPQVVGSCVGFARRLGGLAMLHDVHYDRDTRVLSGRAASHGQIVNFFTGHWFELWVIDCLLTASARLNMPMDWLMNGVVKLPNEQIREIDVFALVEGRPLWVECKTGEYLEAIQRFKALQQCLRISPAQSVLVVLEAPANTTAQLRQLWGLQILGLTDFAEAVTHLMTGDALNLETPLITRTAYSITDGGLSIFLKKQKLRPLPEVRELILSQLLSLPPEVIQDKFITDVADAICETGSGISKNKCSDILRAVVLGGGLEGEGKPLGVFQVKALRSTEIGDLQEACRMAYALVILQADEQWFITPQHCRIFRTETGFEPPDQTTLEQLLERAKELAAVEQ